MRPFLLFLGAACVLQPGPFACAQPAASDCAAIARSLPPQGLVIPAEQALRWREQIEALGRDARDLPTELSADVDVLVKACRYAIDFRELYSEKDFSKVDRLLELARQRVSEFRSEQSPWARASGRQVRGFRSRVDGSAQPLGLVLPERWRQAGQELPLYVWLHGRGDKATDLHFICERLDQDGQIVPDNAIVLHPFGRQCIGFKSAGETDVMEAIDFVCANYPIDRRRIVLAGFSMGGAGVWHLAAHYGERFVAASPGAGFAETARYQNLKPEQFPSEVEQTLWSIYDVPGYTRNLFNLPIVAYSGEMDKQVQAARVMEEAFEKEGRTLTHLIGPGMGHKYHPDTLQEILAKLAAAVRDGQPAAPQEIFIQSKHPRYSTRNWLTIDGAASQYSDTRATATRQPDGHWRIVTQNATRLRIAAQPGAPQDEVTVDDATIALRPEGESLLSRSGDGNWQLSTAFTALRKHPGLSGPIDDAFIDPFLVVLPSGTAASAEVRHWVDCELETFRQRWAMVFRGELRTKQDTEVTEQDMRDYHLVLWGDPSSNRVIRQLLAPSPGAAFDVPFRWSTTALAVGQTERPAEGHVLVGIYPNPRSPQRYMVLNSGPTFRSAHDRTNSLQNPHLPDWAIISLAEPPSAERPGAIAAAGFFSDAWQSDPNEAPPTGRSDIE